MKTAALVAIMLCPLIAGNSASAQNYQRNLPNHYQIMELERSILENMRERYELTNEIFLEGAEFVALIALGMAAKAAEEVIMCKHSYDSAILVQKIHRVNQLNQWIPAQIGYLRALNEYEAQHFLASRSMTSLQRQWNNLLHRASGSNNITGGCRNKPRSQIRSSALPTPGCTNMATCCADLQRQYNAAIAPISRPPFAPSWEAQKQVLANAAPIEQQLQACRRQASGLAPLQPGGQPIWSAAPYQSPLPTRGCGITGRC